MSDPRSQLDATCNTAATGTGSSSSNANVIDADISTTQNINPVVAGASSNNINQSSTIVQVQPSQQEYGAISPSSANRGNSSSSRGQHGQTSADGINALISNNNNNVSTASNISNNTDGTQIAQGTPVGSNRGPVRRGGSSSVANIQHDNSGNTSASSNNNNNTNTNNHSGSRTTQCLPLMFQLSPSSSAHDPLEIGIREASQQRDSQPSALVHPHLDHDLSHIQPANPSISNPNLPHDSPVNNSTLPTHLIHENHRQSEEDHNIDDDNNDDDPDVNVDQQGSIFDMQLSSSQSIARARESISNQLVRNLAQAQQINNLQQSFIRNIQGQRVQLSLHQQQQQLQQSAQSNEEPAPDRAASFRSSNVSQQIQSQALSNHRSASVSQQFGLNQQLLQQLQLQLRSEQQQLITTLQLRQPRQQSQQAMHLEEEDIEQLQQQQEIPVEQRVILQHRRLQPTSSSSSLAAVASSSLSATSQQFQQPPQRYQSSPQELQCGLGSDKLAVSTENLDFVKCPICMHIYSHPIACGNCLNHFCKVCIGEWLYRTPGSCPLCKQFREMRCVPMLKNMLDKLQFFCSNREQGCEAILSYEQVSKHENICDFKLQVCPIAGCGMEMIRRVLDKHVDEECEFVIGQCKWCREKVKKRLLDQHEEQCNERQIICELCGTGLLQKQRHQHLDTVCTDRLCSCQWCHQDFKRKFLESHEDCCSERVIKCTGCGMLCCLNEHFIHAKQCLEIAVLCTRCMVEMKRKDLNSHTLEQCLENVQKSSQAQIFALQAENNELKKEIQGKLTEQSQSLARLKEIIMPLLKPQMTFRFSTSYKDQDIFVNRDGKTALVREIKKKRRDRFVIVDYPQPLMQQSTEVTFKVVSRRSEWFAIGICDESNVYAARRYHDIGHLSYLISANGILYSSHSTQDNWQNRPFRIDQGNVITVQFVVVSASGRQSVNAQQLQQNADRESNIGNHGSPTTATSAVSISNPMINNSAALARQSLVNPILQSTILRINRNNNNNNNNSHAATASANTSSIIHNNTSTVEQNSSDHENITAAISNLAYPRSSANHIISSSSSSSSNNRRSSLPSSNSGSIRSHHHNHYPGVMELRFVNHSKNQTLVIPLDSQIISSGRFYYCACLRCPGDTIEIVKNPSSSVASNASVRVESVVGIQHHNGNNNNNNNNNNIQSQAMDIEEESRIINHSLITNPAIQLSASHQGLLSQHVQVSESLVAQPFSQPQLQQIRAPTITTTMSRVQGSQQQQHHHHHNLTGSQQSLSGRLPINRDSEEQDLHDRETQ